MNTEIKITLIACIILFTGIGILALNTNSNSVIISQPEISKQTETKNVVKSPNLAEYPQTTLKKIDDNLSLRITTIILSIPENNKHPWGFLTGKVIDAAPGHPVIIQFFKSLDEIPVYVAQINLNDDDSFEYKFRLFSIDEGKTTHFFSGDYYIKIFKTVTVPVDE